MDVTDRNRTSPFAFTGNRFEFRMCGSSQSIAGSNIVLTTAMAEVLSEVADRLEAASDVFAEANNLILEYYRNHRRVIFNGNSYGDEWVAEAEKRSLPNITSSVEALLQYGTDESIALFEKHKVLSRLEVESRVVIYLETYSKQINIEAGVMVEMAERLIYPAVADHAAKIYQAYEGFIKAGLSCDEQKSILTDLNANIEGLLNASRELNNRIQKALEMEHDPKKQALEYYNSVVPAMEDLRKWADSLEKMTDKRLWPYPSYEDLLFIL